MNVKDHINKFNKFITQLLSVEVKIDEEDQTIILLASSPKSSDYVFNWKNDVDWESGVDYFLKDRKY